MGLAELLWASRVLGPQHLLGLWRARRTYLELVPGHYAARAIGGLLEVRFFDELRAQRVVNVDVFAAAHSLDAEILRALANYLCALSVLESEAGNYRLRDKGHAVVERMRGAIDMSGAWEDPLHALVPLLRREIAYGTDVRREGRLLARASGAGGALFSHPLLIDIIARKGFSCVLDLACGDGAFLVSLCTALPRITAYGVDLTAAAIDDGYNRIRNANLGDRVHLSVGNVLQPEALADRFPRVDVITFLYGCEQFLTLGRDAIVALLRKWRVLFPSAPVIVCELLKRDPAHLRRHPGGMAELQLGLALGRQRLATDEDWMATWHAAGFRRIERKRLDFAHTAIYVLGW